MAGQTKRRHGRTLEPFLQRPDLDESPVLEFLDGRVMRNAVPDKKHGLHTMQKFRHATDPGSPRGWFLDPDSRAIDVDRPVRLPERRADNGVLEGEPDPPGFRPLVAEVFGGLTLRNPAGGPDAP